MSFDTSIPTKDAFPKVTAEQIAAGFKEFLAVVNNPVEVYRNTKANSVFLINRVFETSGADALLFGGSYLEVFHLCAVELPDQVLSPEEKLQAERDREKELEARDRADGRAPRHLSEAEIEAQKEAEQAAFEKTKADLNERMNQIRNAPPKIEPTAADAFAALKATDLSRASIIAWRRQFPSHIIKQVDAFPFDRKTNRTWRMKMDDILAGRE